MCNVSLSQQFSGWSCSALVIPCTDCMPGPSLPTRTSLLLIWEVLTILMVTITPLCQFYVRTAWILHSNVQSLYRFQSSLISQTLNGKAFIGQGSSGGELGPSQKDLSLQVDWKESLDFPRWQRSPELLRKGSLFPDIERTVYLLLHAGKRRDPVKDKVSWIPIPVWDRE